MNGFIWLLAIQALASEPCSWQDRLATAQGITKIFSDSNCSPPESMGEFLSQLPDEFRTNWVATTSGQSAQPAHLPDLRHGETAEHASFRFFMRGKSSDGKTLTFSFATNPKGEAGAHLDRFIELSVWDPAKKDLTLAQFDLKRRHVSLDRECKSCHGYQNQHLWSPGLAEYFPSKHYPGSQTWLNKFKSKYSNCESNPCDEVSTEIGARIQALNWNNNSGSAERYGQEIASENILRFGRLLKDWNPNPKQAKALARALLVCDKPNVQIAQLYRSFTSEYFDDAAKEYVKSAMAFSAWGEFSAIPPSWTLTDERTKQAEILAGVDDMLSDAGGNAPSISEVSLLIGRIPPVSILDGSNRQLAVREWMPYGFESVSCDQLK